MWYSIFQPGLALPTQTAYRLASLARMSLRPFSGGSVNIGLFILSVCQWAHRPAPLSAISHYAGHTVDIGGQLLDYKGHPLILCLQSGDALFCRS